MDEVIKATVVIFRTESSCEMNLKILDLLRRLQGIGIDGRIATIISLFEKTSSPLYQFLSQPQTQQQLIESSKQLELNNPLCREFISALKHGDLIELPKIEKLISELGSNSSSQGSSIHLLALSSLEPCKRDIKRAELWKKFLEKAFEALGKCEIFDLISSTSFERIIQSILGFFHEISSHEVLKILLPCLLNEENFKQFQMPEGKWSLNEIIKNCIRISGRQIDEIFSERLRKQLKSTMESISQVNNPIKQLLEEGTVFCYENQQFKILFESIIHLIFQAGTDEKTLKMISNMAKVIITWLQNSLFKVQVNDLQGNTETPLGKTNYKLGNISLSGLATNSESIFTSIAYKSGYFVLSLIITQFSAIVNDFKWDYELDTGISLISDKGVGNCKVTNGSAKICFFIENDSKILQYPRISLNDLQFKLGKIETKVNSSNSNSGSIDKIYNWLLNFASETIVNAVQQKVISQLSLKVEDLIKTINQFIQKEYPQKQNKQSDLRDFFSSEDFL